MGSVIKKKRGRPVGSKNKPKIVKLLDLQVKEGAKKAKQNKPKVIRLTQAQVNLAKKVGVSVEQYAKEKLKLDRKPRRKAIKVNWERLAKQLQKALHDEIVENQGLAKRIDDLSYQVANLEHQAIGYRAVVSYLENQLGNDKV